MYMYPLKIHVDPFPTVALLFFSLMFTPVPRPVFLLSFLTLCSLLLSLDQFSSLLSSHVFTPLPRPVLSLYSLLLSLSPSHLPPILLHAPDLRGVGVHTEHARPGVWSGETSQAGKVQCGHNVQHDGRLVCLSTLHQEGGQEGLPA